MDSATDKDLILEIQKMVAKDFRMDLSTLLSRQRARQFSYPRMLAMYVVREVTKESFPYIAVRFNNVHHTSVMHACQWARDNYEYKGYIENTFKRIERKFSCQV